MDDPAPGTAHHFGSAGENLNQRIRELEERNAHLDEQVQDYLGQAEKLRVENANLKDEVEGLRLNLGFRKRRERAEAAWAESLRPDAERWRALVGCARIRALGSAGLVKPNPNRYAHLGLELWTHHTAGSDPGAIEWLIKFADCCVALRGNETGEHPSLQRISGRLRLLAAGMKDVAVAMDYYGGFPWQKHAKELLGAADKAEGWAAAMVATGEGAQG